MTAERLTAGRITVELSNTGKVLFPGDGITKGDLVRYYLGAAGAMLPLLRDRPLTLVRYPDGIGSGGVLQKNAPRYFPDWITRAAVPKQGGTVQHVICDKPATLAYLANQACIELHAALSKRDALDCPDQLIFDLDPPDDRHFADVRRVALLLRDLLEGELGLTCFVKTTGGKGVHVHVAVQAGDDFDTVRQFARQVADVLVARQPRLLTTEQRRDKRGSRIYADVMRNGYSQTAIAPYAVRARPGAPVATPLSWSELDSDLSPHDFTIATVPGRLAGLNHDGDPWAAMPRRRYRLSRARGKLDQVAA
ncbi:MAG TPA: non-homologous end-joining DNA ligase [Streptosporangiaceae bacterium]|nr:non-homologous end-joining DNA ligase [Streptosporangiaceae bacterium]